MQPRTPDKMGGFQSFAARARGLQANIKSCHSRLNNSRNFGDSFDTLKNFSIEKLRDSHANGQTPHQNRSRCTDGNSVLVKTSTDLAAECAVHVERGLLKTSFAQAKTATPNQMSMTAAIRRNIHWGRIEAQLTSELLRQLSTDAEAL